MFRKWKKVFKNDDKNELKVSLYESQLPSLEKWDIYIHILRVEMLEKRLIS